MDKMINVQKNWEIWQSIEGSLKKWVNGRWVRDVQADLLVETAVTFVARNQEGYSEQQSFRFAQCCCRHAARRLRFWTNQREFADGGEAADVVIADGAEAADQSILVRQVLDIIDKKCCKELQIVTRLLISGTADTLQEAATMAGVGVTKASRHYRTLGRLLSGRVRITSARRQNTQQLQLFS